MPDKISVRASGATADPGGPGGAGGAQKKKQNSAPLTFQQEQPPVYIWSLCAIAGKAGCDCWLSVCLSSLSVFHNVGGVARLAVNIVNPAVGVPETIPPGPG